LPRQRRTRDYLEAENAFLKNRRFADGVASVAVAIVKWTGRGVVAYFSFRSVEVLAGKATSANIMVQMIQKLNIGESGDHSLWLIVLPALVAVGFAVYGLRERKLRKDTTARIHGRTARLEKLVDTNRTSSTLTPRGETSEEDKV